MAAQSTCLGRLKEYLTAQGVAFELERHPLRYTAQELAQVEHVPGRLVAKVVMVLADERLIMVVVPAPMKISLPLVREALGAKHIRLAQEGEFGHIFPDCEVGAMPPFGHLYGVPVVVDVALAQDPVIFFNAGSHEDVVTMTYEDFERLARPRRAAVAMASETVALSA